MAIKRYKRLTKLKRPKHPYPIVQGWGFMVTPNFVDMVQDLSELYYEAGNVALENDNFYSVPEYKTDLGPVYALCENYIRFRKLAPEAYTEELNLKSLPEIATEQDVINAISNVINEPIDNFDYIKVLEHTRKIIRRYDKKYGNNKWRKEVKYVGKDKDPENDVTSWRWIRKRGNRSTNKKNNKV